MKIRLITLEQHTELLAIYKSFRNLSLQNKGYEYINKDTLTDEEKSKLEEIEVLLKNAIHGFTTFNNFRLSKDNKPQIRFQYNYNYDESGTFIGVGYILIDELLNGFGL